MTQPFSIGLFLARVLPGSHITMEHMRVGNGIWMPQHIEIRAAAKIFFIKSLIIDKVLIYLDYRPAQTAPLPSGETGRSREHEGFGLVSESAAPKHRITPHSFATSRV